MLPVNGLYVPDEQAVQAVEEVLPVNGLYVPAAQAVQADDPVDEYVPAGQTVVHADRPDALKVPDAQAMQAAEEVLPVNGLYVPAAQSVQADWLAVLL